MSALLEVRDLRVLFQPRRRRGVQRPIAAVDGVSLDLERGRTLGLVGESGCGKSTTALSLVGLTAPTSGSIRLDGKELVGLKQSDWRPVRRRIQMVFQDPLASLDPRHTVGRIVGEPLDVHAVGTQRERRMRVLALLEAVGLKTVHYNLFPHELSGGQCQRVAIARALSVEPDLLVCDEPLSALDVSVQAKVVNLIAELQERFGLALLFISHDLGIVRRLCDEIAIMYLGRVVERAERHALFERQAHPYTRALLSAIPVPDPVYERRRERTILAGDVPSPAELPTGCRFHPRCPSRAEVPEDRCAREDPPLVAIEGGRACACHLNG